MFRIFLFYIAESILACCAGWLFLLVIIVLTTGMGVSRVSSAVGFVMLGVGLVFCAALTALFLGLPLIRFLQDREATLRQQGDVQ